MEFKRRKRAKRTNKKKVGFYIDKDLYEKMKEYKEANNLESLNVVLENWIKNNC